MLGVSNGPKGPKMSQLESTPALPNSGCAFAALCMVCVTERGFSAERDGEKGNVLMFKEKA